MHKTRDARVEFESPGRGGGWSEEHRGPAGGLEVSRRPGGMEMGRGNF